MLVKIVTVVVTVVLLIALFAPMLSASAWGTGVAAPAFHCVRCNRSFGNAETFTWHQQAMHPELAVELLDSECTVSEAQPMVKPDIAPTTEPPESKAPIVDDVVEVRSGDRVYRVYTGGRK